MCATLNEFLSDKKLWVAVQAVKPFPFLEGNLSQVMESSLKVMYGQRLMFTPFETLSIEEVAMQLVMLHGDKWMALTTATTDLNLAGDYIIRKKGSKDKDTTKTGTSSTEHQTIAYNEEILSTETGDSANTSETGGETEATTGDEEKISYTSYFKNLQSADQLDIMNSILRDSARLLTINVY